MAQLFHITHDANDFSEYTTAPSGGAGDEIELSAAAGLGGTAYGLEVDSEGNADSGAKTFSGSSAAGVVRFGFRSQLNTLSLLNGDEWEVIGLISDTTAELVYVYWANSGSGPRLAVYSNDDAGDFQFESTAALINSDTTFEVVITQASSDVASDGKVELYINGVLDSSATGRDNYDFFNSYFSVGIRSFEIDPVLPGTTTGVMYLDEIIVRDDNTPIYPPPGGALTLAAMTKPADIDAAGEFVYVALLEGGTPILTKISAALDADGATVFNPGAGDNIGVECGRFDADVVWVAGNFDGTNVVEKSEDGGSTFTVKDNGAIGDVRAFVMGPDSDDKILVFDETNGDILETRDDGASWTTINASVTPEVNAIARLGINVQESVFGNQGAANDNVDYSVNSGSDLEDFNLPVNENVTRVIVN